ncbi:MAG: hypothetical protein Q7R84_02005 [bacterium]|nr:hypothetical protein [bacterium]
METKLEIATKIIGSDDGGKKRFYGSLADALRDFLEGEIFFLKIGGIDFFFEFSSRGGRIGRQSPGEFERSFIEAPKVFLRILGCNKTMTEIHDLGSLEEAFCAFFERGFHSIQLYEQVVTAGGGGLTNYMIVMNCDEVDPRKVLLHLHNIDAKSHFWRTDFYTEKQGGDFVLIPLIPFGSHHRVAVNDLCRN